MHWTFRALAALVLAGATPAAAVIGGAPVSDGDPVAAETVIITGGQGFCTGAVLGERLVLAPAH